MLEDFWVLWNWGFLGLWAISTHLPHRWVESGDLSWVEAFRDIDEWKDYGGRRGAKFGRLQVFWGRFPGFCRCLGLWVIPYSPISWKWRFQANWKKLLGALMDKRVMVWWKENWGSRGKFWETSGFESISQVFVDLWVCGLSIHLRNQWVGKVAIQVAWKL